MRGTTPAPGTIAILTVTHVPLKCGIQMSGPIVVATSLPVGPKLPHKVAVFHNGDDAPNEPPVGNAPTSDGYKPPALLLSYRGSALVCFVTRSQRSPQVCEDMTLAL